ncbi:hypothetical protein LIER_28736 [Lithospermum erythrorhizon]|uniref:Uncharacterized protein n=1 Tax=Lithospermum erythrorhizon TaxID=34254 RepID=A0AAV3RGR1_LITER
MPLLTPVDPMKELPCNPMKWQVLNLWIGSNVLLSDGVGLDSVVKARGLPSTISKKELQILTSQRQWLNDEHINATLHLLNMQEEEYARSFQTPSGHA